MANMTRLTICGASFAVAVVMLVFVFFYDRRQIHIGTVIYQLFYSGFVEIFSWMHVYSESRIFNFYHYVRRDCGVFRLEQGFTILQIWGCGSYEALTFAAGRKERLAGKNTSAWCWICLWWCLVCFVVGALVHARHNGRPDYPMDSTKVLKGKIFTSYPNSFL